MEIELTLLSFVPESSGSLSVEETHLIVKMNPVGLGLAEVVAEAEVRGDWLWQKNQSKRGEHSDGPRRYRGR